MSRMSADSFYKMFTISKKACVTERFAYQSSSNPFYPLQVLDWSPTAYRTKRPRTITGAVYEDLRTMNEPSKRDLRRRKSHFCYERFMEHLVRLDVPIVKHCTYLKNHYGLEFPDSSISLEAVLELDTCFSFTAAWDAFVVGLLCPDAEFLFVTHGYVYDEPWGGAGTFESEHAAMPTYNGGSNQSDQDRYEGEDDEEPSEVNLDATKVGEYDWHAETAAVLSDELYAGAGTFVRAARKAGIIRLELATSLPEVSLEQLNGCHQLAAAIPVAYMRLQAMRASKPLPAPVHWM
jgi:hypothetical protein